LGNPGDERSIIFGGSRHARRLSDKLLIEFYQACEDNTPKVALRLLDELESMIRDQSRPNSVERRKLVDKLIAAHERLWHILHPAELLTGELAELRSTCRKIIH
jgi:hypothetical protein